MCYWLTDYLLASDNAPEHALRPGFLSTFALANTKRANSDFQKMRVSFVTITPTKCFSSIFYLLSYNEDCRQPVGNYLEEKYKSDYMFEKNFFLHT